jgi:predicted RNA-binding Zn-ribbon protein involved in translation (DUF1610 family)
VNQESNIVFGISRKSLEATVIHACPHCEAPGVYKNDARTKEFWRGCFDPTRVNQHVGDKCPNCGRRRLKDTNLGELTASMSRWMWRCVLAVKWLTIKLIRFKHQMRQT